jgi:hypothetical protein
MKIQEIEIPLIGIATELIIQINPFTTDDKTCSLYYTVQTDSRVKVKEGNYTLTEDEYLSWGADNSYVEDLILKLPENKLIQRA